MFEPARLTRVLLTFLFAILVASITQVVVLAKSEDAKNLNKLTKDSQTQTELAPELSPRDKLIYSTALSHSMEIPDPNEPLEALQGYLDGMKLFEQPGEIDRAVTLFENLVTSYPDARHTWEGLGTSLRKRYELNGRREDLRRASDAYTKAIEIGLSFGRIPVKDLWPAAVSLGQLGEVETLDRVFGSLVQQHPTDHTVVLEYARGLAYANHPRAEEMFKKAIQLRPTGSWDSVVEYGEWLVERQRYRDAVEALVLRPGEETRYLNFLRGFAYEKLGDKGKAKQEYKTHLRLTEKYPGVEESYPMPEEYRILGSELQVGITFSGDFTVAEHCTGHIYLARMIWCEARGEPQGARHAVGWVARNRMYNGDMWRTINGQSVLCMDTNNSGTSVCSKYYNVITYGGNGSSFWYSCDGSTNNSDSVKQAAYDVYYGYAPEPSMSVCPSGESFTGDKCEDKCSQSNYSAGYAAGDVYHLGVNVVGGTVSCPATHPSAPQCTLSDGNLCGDDAGGSDNCFYFIRP